MLKEKLKISHDIECPNHYIVIRTLKPAKSTGSILLPDQCVDASLYQSSIGQVLKIGDDAFKESDFFSKNYCKEGDYIYFNKNFKEPWFISRQKTKELDFGLFLIPPHAVFLVHHKDDIKNLYNFDIYNDNE